MAAAGKTYPPTTALKHFFTVTEQYPGNKMFGSRKVSNIYVYIYTYMNPGDTLKKKSINRFHPLLLISRYFYLPITHAYIKRRKKSFFFFCDLTMEATMNQLKKKKKIPRNYIILEKIT